MRVCALTDVSFLRPRALREHGIAALRIQERLRNVGPSAGCSKSSATTPRWTTTARSTYEGRNSSEIGIVRRGIPRADGIDDFGAISGIARTPVLRAPKRLDRRGANLRQEHFKAFNRSVRLSEASGDSGSAATLSLSDRSCPLRASSIAEPRFGNGPRARLPGAMTDLSACPSRRF